jgi:tRNA(Ile)-lysidine synthase
MEGFDRRLDPNRDAPLLIGLSGGGDSLALLLLARDWAQKTGRPLVAATVDHKLRPEGADWARRCAARCAALGVDHLTLIWTGTKPATGLHAAARLARHRLLAEAARGTGASVILLAHTADDRLEAAWMRREGARTPSPRAWSPSPVWPEGRDIFLLRPLLAVRRAALRTYLRERGEDWIEDPGNVAATSLRARARLALAGVDFALSSDAPEAQVGMPPLTEGPAGELFGPSRPLLAQDRTAARLGLGAALTCVGGSEATPAPGSLAQILRRLEDGTPFAATLVGARLIFDGATVVIAREAGDRRLGRAQPVPLSPDAPVIWDGRYLVGPGDPAWSIGHLKGRMARLDRASRAALKCVHPAARQALPVLIGPAGEVVCPTLEASRNRALRALITPRLAARCGAIQHESDLAAWRNA